MTQTFSRRRLLGASGLAASGLVLQHGFHQSASIAAGPTSPSEQVTIAHIGVGTRGGQLMKAAERLDLFRTLAIADCFEDRREIAAAKVKADAYQDFRKIMDLQDIDGVVIATPAHWHVKIAMMALAAGKDVYLEKPLALTLDQGKALRDACHKSDRVLQYGTQQREAEHLKFGRDLVRDGKVGEVRGIEVKAPNGGRGGSTKVVPVPDGLDYDMWLGPAPKAPYTTDRCLKRGPYWIYDYSLGFLADWGAHPLDVLIWCYDGDMSGPFTVEGTGEIPTKGLYNTIINWDIQLTFANGVKVHFVPGHNSTKFLGTRANLELTRGTIRANPKELLPESLVKSYKDMRAEHFKRTADHVLGFAEAIKTRGQCISPIDDAIRSDRISQLCDIAVRTGEKITYDPVKEKIIGGSEKAKSMASRPMRGPWIL